MIFALIGAACLGVAIGMIVGKLLTEREMVEYMDIKYQDGLSEGYEIGWEERGYAEQ